MHHFFVPPSAIIGQQIHLPPEAAHQVARVLRLRPGAEILALDDHGWAYPLTLTQVSPQQVIGTFIARQPAPAEPPIRLTLYQALLKKDNFEWVLQKGTELGVSAFVPLITARTVADTSAQKTTRWQRIITEAAEQCRRGRLPTLHPALDFPAALTQAAQATLAVLPYEAATHAPLTLPADLPPAAELALIIGPEGGFTAEEVDVAQQHGLTIVTLGPRTLRAETAALAAVTLIMQGAGGLQ